MNNNSREFEIDAINFWDRQLTTEEMTRFHYMELKISLYKKIGINVTNPALVLFEENLALRMN